MSYYQLYPAYKDSGVEWLGHLPAHWDAKRLRRVAEIENSGCYGAEDLSLDSPIGIKTSTTAHITSGGNFLIEEMSVRYFTVAEADKYTGKVGDIFVVKSSGSNANIISGKLARVQKSSGKIVFTNFLMRVRADDKIIDPVFLEYFLGCTVTRRRIEKMVATTTYPNIDVEEYSLALLPIPPLQEQLQICSALDRETARLDALVSKKTRFIELLREKRQALITHAVTKGLDPNVKMKDSGVEWLGEVPEHWSIRPLKQLARLDGGAGFPDDEQGDKDAPIPFFKVADLANGLTTAENYITPEAAERLRAKVFPAGTIAFAKVGAALLLNRRVLMPLPGCADNNMMVALPQGVSGEWLLSVLSCFDMAWLVNPGAVPSVNQEQVGNIMIPVPSAEEQASIVAGVRSGVTRIDALVGKTERSIELLKERRSALITAAVTGQIDLRDE